MIVAGTQIDLIYETIGSITERVVLTGIKSDISDLIKKHNLI
jgi:hypothetical protein